VPGITRRRFEQLVDEALAGLPPELGELLDNVAVVVEEEPTPEDLESVGLDPREDELFGLYQGIPHTERGSEYSALPDRVVLYRSPILRCCSSRREVIREVRDTLVHELGHHFGLSDDEMPY
jgi:predicted Zn-dependent protease with MMP-like domain